MATVAPGLRAQSPLRLTRRLSDREGFRSIDTGDEIDYPYAFRADMFVVAGRYELRDIMILGGKGIIGTGWLARTPIAELRLFALNYTNLEIDMSAPGDVWEVYANRYIEDACVVLRATPPMSQPETLAMVYRVIRLGWRSPVARLAALLGVHHDTVRRWIVAAVKSGHLEPWERG